MFKQLTNTRPAPQNQSAELATTPSSGTLKVNTTGVESIGINLGDYLAILEDDAEGEWKGIWVTKGYPAKTEDDGKGGKKIIEDQFGNKVSTASGKNAGSMHFASESAFRALKGNDQTRVVYSIGEGIRNDSFPNPLHKLTFVREEPKSVKVPKEPVVG